MASWKILIGVGVPLVGFPLNVYEQALWAQACQEITNETEIVSVVQTNTLKVLQEDVLRNLNLIVDRYWQQLQMDDLINQVVDDVIKRYRENTSVWERVKAGLIPSDAKELAQRIARDVFNDPRIKSRLNQLAYYISQDIAQRIQHSLSKIQNQITQCLNLALENRIPPVISAIARKDLEYSLNNNLKTVQVEAPTVLPTGTMAGAALILLRKRITDLVVRRISAGLTERIAASLAKRVVARLIPIIGIALTAWDAYHLAKGDEFFNGLEKALKSPEVKEKFRQEIVKTLREDLSQSLDSLANEIAKTTFLTYEALLKQYQAYAQIVEQDPALNQALQRLTVEGKIDEANKLLDLALTLKRLGIYSQLHNYLNSPQRLELILKVLPEGYPILEYTHSLDALYPWAQLVDGNKRKIQRVVDWELYKYIKASELNKQTLDYLLQFSNGEVVKLILTTLSPEELKTLTKIKPALVEEFTSKYASRGLTCLVFYTQINPRLGKVFLELSLEEPKYLKTLCSEKVKQLVKENPSYFDQIKELLLNGSTLVGKLKTFVLMLSGHISPEVYKAFYPSWFYGLITIVGLVALAVLWKVGKLISPLFKFVLNKKPKESREQKFVSANRRKEIFQTPKEGKINQNITKGETINKLQEEKDKTDYLKEDKEKSKPKEGEERQ